MNIQLNIPTTWNQLPPKTLKKIAWYFFTNKTGKELDLLIYFAILNIRWWQLLKILNAFRILKQVTIQELKNHYSFLYNDFNLTKFIPSVKIKNTTLIAPGDRLHNITIEEFAICEDLQWYYTTTNNINYIKHLIAVLYRKVENGKKVPFSKSELETEAAKLKKIDKKTMAAIALCYKGSSLEIQQSYPSIFKKAAPTTTKKNKKPTPPGFGNLIQQMAGEKFGNLAETKKTNVHDFLSEYAILLQQKTLK
jgi:hypothetical protein